MGDTLWGRRLPERDRGGQPWPLDEGVPPRWSLLWRMTTALEELGEPFWLYAVVVVVFLPALVFDAVHGLLRGLLYPLVLLAWRFEVWLARRKGRRYFCAACHHSMTEPWVYCAAPDCPRPIQPRLRPRFNSLLVRRCSACGRGRWWLLGGRLLSPPTTLVCRHTGSTSGCFRPLRILDLAGRYRARHVALAGTSVAARHAVLGHLLYELAQGYEPSWEGSERERELGEQVLCAAFRDGPTEPYDRPGARYTLAWTCPWRSRSRGRVVCLHNLLDEWFARTDLLARYGTNWGALHGLILVVDPYRLLEPPVEGMLPPEEYFGRLVRVTEEYCGLPAGARLPYRVAVVLAVPQGCVALGEVSAMTEEEVTQLLREHAPGLACLAERAAGRQRVRYFAGVVPPQVGTGATGWLREAVEWAAG